MMWPLIGLGCALAVACGLAGGIRWLRRAIDQMRDEELDRWWDDDPNST